MCEEIQHRASAWSLSSQSSVQTLYASSLLVWPKHTPFVFSYLKSWYDYVFHSKV